jgi:hypothetical protein
MEDGAPRGRRPSWPAAEEDPSRKSSQFAAVARDRVGAMGTRFLSLLQSNTGQTHDVRRPDACCEEVEGDGYEYVEGYVAGKIHGRREAVMRLLNPRNGAKPFPDRPTQPIFGDWRGTIYGTPAGAYRGRAWSRNRYLSEWKREQASRQECQHRNFMLTPSAWAFLH